MPPLVIDGIPTPVEKMTQAQLRAFIPLMLKYSTGKKDIFKKLLDIFDRLIGIRVKHALTRPRTPSHTLTKPHALSWL